MPLLLLKRNRTNIEIVAKDRAFPNVKELFSMCATFLFAVFAFIFFRAESVGDALLFIQKILSDSFLTMPKIENVGKITIGSILLSTIILIIVEWVNRREEYGFKRQSKYKLVRWIVYGIIAMMILELVGEGQGFIYFQF
jgi:uncharacterized membrane protein